MEKDRLELGVFKLEKARTQEIISRYAGSGCLKIADIGGATGVYSFWLQEQGHEVWLLDATQLHVDIARETAEQRNLKLASIEKGDARSLPYPDDFFDLVLLMGPLYHLQDAAERLQALKEARRVLKPGGTLLGAAISRYASLLDGFWRGLIDDPGFRKILDQDLQNGRHENPGQHPEYFTSAYFHLREELLHECLRSGMEKPEVLAVEGFGWLIPSFLERWNDPDHRRQLLDYIRQTETDAGMVAISAHIIVAAQKKPKPDSA